jgi:hypothetical protein
VTIKLNVRRLLLFLTIVPAVFVSLNAKVYYNGNEIYKHCGTNQPFVNGFVAGAFDRSSLDQAQGYCAPEAGTLGQIADIFCQYLAKHPEKRHVAGADLLNTALAEAWPCK